MATYDAYVIVDDAMKRHHTLIHMHRITKMGGIFEYVKLSAGAT